ncbi:MAG: signal recognition particle protein, partial [Clostridiales bacterium]|nr:signal recognition particle protein [Clostridiales bacterium]
AERLKQNKFTLSDYLEQLEQLKSMGNIKDIAAMIPGVDSKTLKNATIDEKAFAHTEAIIKSMTPEERENPSILNGSRKKRIAAGSGTTVVDVNRLIKQFDMMKSMTKQMTASGKKAKRMGMGYGKMPFPF